MKGIKVLLGVVASALLLSGCNLNNTSKGGMIGAAAGGAAGTGLGAAIGALIGGSHGAKVGAAIGAGVGVAGGTTAGVLIGKKMDKAKAAAEAALQDATVETTTDTNGLDAVKVTFDNGILFPVGKYALQAAAKNELSKFSNVLKNNADLQVDIQGYASSDGSNEVNQVLSNNRANSVKAYLVNTCGVPSSQIKSARGFGETNLITNADGTENVKASRRVEVYLYASQAMIDKANAGQLN